MKKLVLIAAAFILMLPTAFAQKGLHAGLKVTPITTWMFNKDVSDAGVALDYKTTFGYMFGATVNYHFTDGFGLGADFLYSSQGQSYKGTAFGIDYEGKQNIKYLKIPVLIHFNTNSEEVVYFQGSFGPQFGLLLAAKAEDFAGGSTDNKEAFKSLNIGLVLGFGLGFNVHENFKIHAGLRFDGAFADAEDKDSAYWLTQPGGADREVTRNVTGGVELGFIYVLPVR
jgi:opacity protein-like surface antigen